MDPTSGVLWLIIDVVLVAALGAALVYGVMMTHRAYKNRALKKVRDDATRDLYRKPDPTS